MNTSLPNPIHVTEIGQLVRLLADNVPDVSPCTVWEGPWTWQHYDGVRSDDQLVAAGSLQPLGDGRAEIRGLVVHQDWRGEKLATRVVDHLLDRARSLGLDAVCVTRKPEFFKRFGFAETTPSWLDWRRQGLGSPSRSRDIDEPRIAMTKHQGTLPC